MTGAKNVALKRRLARARIAAGYKTVSEGARAAGIPVPTATAHESLMDCSTRMPKLPALLRYAKTYGVSLEWLVQGGGA